MEDFFNISVFRALLNFKEREIETYEQLSRYISIEKQLRFDSNLDVAESLLIDYGFKVFRENSYLHENKLLVLYNLVEIMQPTWLSQLKKGRESFFDFLKEENEINLIQLFEFCELDSSQLKNVSIWWKLLFQDNYENFSKVLSGIDGEDKTKQYELKMLRKLEIEKSLIDASIEDPGAGYDLISWRKDDNGNLYKIFIETKNNEIIISRNEYEKSVQLNDRYFIYFWTKDSSDKPKKIIDYKFILESAPKDTQMSEWRSLKIFTD